MSNTPTNLRLALTALIHSSNLSLRCHFPSFGMPVPPPDKLNALVSAHVSTATWQDHLQAYVHKVTFKPITECYDTGLRSIEEVKSRQKMTGIKPIAVVLIDIQPTDSWQDIYYHIWRAEGVQEFWSEVMTTYTGRTDIERFCTGWANEPDEYIHSPSAAPEAELAAYFPETCPKTGLSTLLIREARETREKNEWEENSRLRIEREKEEKEAKEEAAKREQEKEDDRLEKQFLDMLKRKENQKEVSDEN